MSEAKSIEGMRAELEAAGIKISQDETPLRWGYRVFFPDDLELFDLRLEDESRESNRNRTIQKAYAHYQREKRYEELHRSYAEIEARLAKVERELDSLRGDGK